MKKYFRYAILPIMAFAILGGVWASASTASADKPMSNLVKAITEKFNLNISDVQAVFDEQRTQMQAEQKEQRQENFINRLNQLVADGKLTQAQADLITTKKAELNAQRESEIANTDSLKQWATDNNIPQEYLMLLSGRMGRGRGGSGFAGSKPEN